MVDSRIVNTKIYIGKHFKECFQRIIELGGEEIGVCCEDPFLFVLQNGQFYSKNSNSLFQDSNFREITPEQLLNIYPQNMEWKGDDETIIGQTEDKEYKIEYLREHEYIIYSRDLSPWAFGGYAYSVEHAQEIIAEKLYKQKSNERK